MEVRFLGHAAFELADGDATVLIDPFLTGNPKAAISADDAAATTILLTHGHADHIGDTVAIAKRTGRAGGGDRRDRRRARRGGRRGVGAQHGRHGQVRLGLGQARARRGTRSTTPKGTVNIPAGLLINFQDTIVYHLGDTCVFSDLQLVGKRHPIDVALMCIGGHYTMDRVDAVDAAELVGAKTVIPCHYNTFPPIETDAQAFKSDVESATQLERRRARPRTVALDVTHAIVLIQADRAGLATLGGELADLEGVAEAYSVTGEWDFVAVLRLRQQEDLAKVVTGQISQLPGVARTHTMVAFEVYSRHDLEALFSVGQ